MKASGAVLLLRQGQDSEIVGIVPQDDEPDAGLVALANRAINEHRVVERIGEPGKGKNAHVSVNVAFTLRVLGRPAAAAFALRVPAKKSDAEIVADIAPEILRRAEDAVAVSADWLAARPLSGLADAVTAAEADGQSDAEPDSDEPRSASGEAAPATPPEILSPGGAESDGTAADLADARRPLVESSMNADTGRIAADTAAATGADQEGAADASSTAPLAPPEPRGDRAEGRPAADAKTALLTEQSAVIAALATVLDQRDFAQSLHAFVNGIARNWGCLRASIGLVRGQRIVIEAVSGVVDFDRKSALMVDIGQALQETHAAASVIVLPAEQGGEAPPQAHVALAAQLKNPALLSLPLVDGEHVIGAVLFERDHAFSDMEQLQLQRMALLLGPVIALKRLESLGSLHWLKRFVRRQLQAVFGSSGLSWKLALIAACLFAVWSAFYTQLFKVDAEAIIEASVHRAVVANIPSFLSEVEKKAGDIVHEGDILAQLDAEDLELERIKWVGERDKLAKEYRANLAQRDRSNVRVLEARRAQAESQIDLLDTQIERATLRAPIDGVVISGDLAQAVGTTVERGQLLFEVASLEDYRLILMVDEADIGWVELGQKGNLRLRSLPDQSFPFVVSAVTPVSEAGDGANRFRVEATLSGVPDSLRPGMGGVAKIEVEPRAIGWIWTHSFVSWLRFQSWKYGL